MESDAGGLWRLLDPAFGFFIWSLHLLVVYIATALACVLAVDADSRTLLVTVFALVTVGAAVIVALHGSLRYRQHRGVQQREFRAALTAGADGIAAFAILWQLIPIFLVPICV